MEKAIKSVRNLLLIGATAGIVSTVPAILQTNQVEAAETPSTALSAPGYGGTSVEPGGGDFTLPSGSDGSSDAAYDPIS